MARYRLNEAALADLDRIYEYGILTFGLQQADKYYDGLLSYFQAIADSPLSHVGVDEIRKGYRRAPYSSDAVYYCVAPDEVVIVRILGQQDPQRALTTS